MTTFFIERLGKRLQGITRMAGLCVAGLLLMGCVTNMDDYNQAMVSSIVNEQESILATGYAVISVQKNDNPAQQRLLSIRASKLDAYRSLM